MSDMRSTAATTGSYQLLTKFEGGLFLIFFVVISVSLRAGNRDQRLTSVPDQELPEHGAKTTDLLFLTRLQGPSAWVVSATIPLCLNGCVSVQLEHPDGSMSWSFTL